MNMLNRPVAALTGIGPQTAKRLQKIGIHTIQDLLFHLPYRYEDHTRLTAIGRLEAGTAALVAGTVEYTDLLNNKRRDLISRISDGTGFISIKFFHYTATHYNNLKAGTLISCYGEVRYGFTGLEMIHPDYKVIDDPDEPVTESHLTPVYPLTEGLTQAVIRKAVKQEPYLTKWGKSEKLTASFGVASFPDDADDSTSLLALADKSMFCVKNTGKDRVRSSFIDCLSEETDLN